MSGHFPAPARRIFLKTQLSLSSAPEPPKTSSRGLPLTQLPLQGPALSLALAARPAASLLPLLVQSRCVLLRPRIQCSLCLELIPTRTHSVSHLFTQVTLRGLLRQALSHLACCAEEAFAPSASPVDTLPAVGNLSHSQLSPPVLEEHLIYDEHSSP